MKYFLLLIPFFILSCGTETSVDEPDVFEPYQVGSWQITSPTNANWIGQTASKMKAAEGDTVTVSDTTAHGMTIYTEENDVSEDQFYLQFEIQELTVDETYQGGIEFRLDLDDSPSFSNFGWSGAGNLITAKLKYTCTPQPEDVEIIIGIYDSEDAFKKAFHFVQDGFEQSVHNMVC